MLPRDAKAAQDIKADLAQLDRDDWTGPTGTTEYRDHLLARHFSRKALMIALRKIEEMERERKNPTHATQVIVIKTKADLEALSHFLLCDISGVTRQSSLQGIMAVIESGEFNGLLTVGIGERSEFFYSFE
jgi:hypothetical protein